MCAFAFLHVTVDDEFFRPMRSQSCRGPELSRNLGAVLFAAMVIGLASPAEAQTIPTTFEPAAPPWNAQRLFDPAPLPALTQPDNREPVAPEDMPVKTRQQPGYEPVGIRDGSWMFLPSILTGGFYDSNVFSSNVMKRSDFAALVEPSLRAYTLWERHGIDVTLDAQQIAYDANPGGIL